MKKKRLDTCKNCVFRAEILDTSGLHSTSHPGKFQNAHPTQARLNFSTPRRPFPGGQWEGGSGGGGSIDGRITRRILMS